MFNFFKSGSPQRNVVQGRSEGDVLKHSDLADE